MNSAATDTAPAPITGWQRFWLAAVLALLALFETWDAFIFFLAIDLPEAGASVRGVVTRIYDLTHPVFALAALICALTGRVRWAVMALAGVVLGRWLWYLPGPNGSLPSKQLYVALLPTLMLVVLPPVLAVAALVLARSNRLLGLATLLVSLPVISDNYDMMLLMVGVSIYGF